MKTQTTFRRAVVFSALFAVLGFLFIGCKSTPKVNWDSRIGNFTYDQAVAELGPPDKTATLSDGRKVADWVERRSSGGLSFGVGTGFSSGSGSAVGVGASSGGPGYREHVLRLTFGTDNQLVAWYKN